MILKVRKLGGSLALIIPHDVAKLMGLVEGTEVRLTLSGRKLTVAPQVPKKPKGKS
jgi:antitoxin component of MazEF toxin-antitoxin module